MKTLHLIIISLVCINLFSQESAEKEIKSEVNEVTVFLEGALVIRNKTVQLPAGETLLKFTELSPFIDSKSVQMKAEGELTVLSLNHQQNFLEKLEKSSTLKQLEEKLEELNKEIRKENVYLSIIAEEITFLHENRDIGGKNTSVSVTDLQQASEFYGEKLTSLKMQEIERRARLEKLNKEKMDLQKQINSLSSKKEFPRGEVLIKVDAKTAGSFNFELSYVVKNTGWFPSYDIRAESIDEPIQMIYKANVKQDTKVDWNNVNLRFSSSNPEVSGVAPELKTYYLNYNIPPPEYGQIINRVSGMVMDSYGESLPGATVVVEGTTIGTVTDSEGNYSITIPNSSVELTYSYIGYESRTLPVTYKTMNVALNESLMRLDEAVVTTRGTRQKSEQAETMQFDDELNSINIRGAQSLAVPTTRVEKPTSVNFEIETPYTIKSDNRNYMVDMEVYDIPAFYQYYSVPKLEEDAFLLANITSWEQYDLLSGEANVFFEGTYVGKTLLDMQNAGDTLEVSMGRDRKVSVRREKIRDYTTKQFIGNKKEETRAWKITVKNNKNQEINMIILDQVPVSTREEIEVDVQDLSGGDMDEETGKVKWEFDLKPGKTKEFELKYSVKYPKNQNLIIE